MRPFNWKNEMKIAELKLQKNILIYEKTGKGNKAAASKLRLAELKKRRLDLFA